MKKLIIFLAVFLFSNPLNIINSYRESVGLNRLKENPSLTLSAKWHSKYLFSNNEITHIQRRYGKNFSGETPAKRAIQSGYASRFVVENISAGEKSYNESIKDLFSAVYHRLGFLNFNIDEIGYYTLKNFYVYEMGNSLINKACRYGENKKSGFAGLCENKNKIISADVYYRILKSNPHYVMWPYNGMKNTPAVFYEEMPDPLPGISVSGYPVSISFNPYYVKNVKVLGFSLFYGNKKVKTKFLNYKNDVNHMLKKTDFVLFPLERLEYGGKYLAVFNAVVDGKIKEYKWSFEVEEGKVPVIEVLGTKGRYNIKPNVTYLIYFRPLNVNDTVSHLKYEYKRGITVKKIGYKDANTVYLELSGKNGGKIHIKTKKRDIYLIIKE